jgi:hypothetical protein
MTVASAIAMTVAKLATVVHYNCKIFIRLGATTFRILTLSITTLSIKSSFATLSLNNSQYNNALILC